MKYENKLAIGIDLGTTNSAISVFRNGLAELIPNVYRQYLTPSVISITEEQSILVGEPAQNRLITYPADTAATFKRYLGTDKKYSLAGQDFSPTELCSIILKSLKEDAETYLQQPIQDVVISVPAYFNDHQRKEVRYSAELAGLNAVRLINEPTAASLAHGIDGSHNNKRYLIFDLGGGTFDITIVEQADTFIEVHASTGDNFLGGEDFTAALVQAVYSKLERSGTDITPAEHAIIVAACERGKKQRYNQLEVQLSSPFSRSFSFRNDELEKIWQPVLARIAKPIKQALKDARISSDEIDEVIFVGGATRLKDIHQMAIRLFGRFVKQTVDPDLVVAMGAAVQAACRLRDKSIEEVILTDVCPYSLGIAIVSESDSGIFSPIIERNTIIPCSRIERYYTTHDEQKHIRISVFQGESFWVAHNILIDSFNIEVPPRTAGSEAVDVRFSYDINGLLEINVTVVSTGKTTNKVIVQHPDGITDAEKLQSLEKLSNLKTHPRDQLENIAFNEKLNSLYEQALGEQRAYLNPLILAFNKALCSQDNSYINKIRKQIEISLSENLN
ncbi:molecular chaperone HscC [Vibrio azureus]|uniref:Chaperone protein HscC n=1 Tax=Vibrio azureus NBRC 104587 TaxID=1219077 RepID=U3ADU5_9VIBR|nr:Hsp70 family protein [Vibrio azureus]AUI85504.1 molecular chaperone HscC [Vibrio azureus]GAD78091.1 chaperone protein HscC [Vibrio azureus NBRC 104587]